MIIHKLLSIAGKIFARNKLNILIYHQVFVEKDAMRPSEPDLKTFTWQMQLISQYFTPLSISEALKHLENDTLPANAICVTFDDGYRNNLDVAAPVLQQFKIPATVYIATGFTHGENMFNDRVIDLIADESLLTLKLSALDTKPIALHNTENRIKAAHYVLAKIKYLPIAERTKLIDVLYQDNNAQEYPTRMLSAEQIKQLHEKGVEIGAHTVEHPILKVLEPEDQKQQIRESKETLEQWLDKEVSGFAYPNGKVSEDYDLTTKSIVETLGFDYAVSTNWGKTTKNSDKYQLNRFTPWDKTPLKFQLRLLRNLH